MKTLLGLIGAFSLTVTTVNPSMAAYSSPTVEPTYQTVIAAIKALNLTSYAMNGTTSVNYVKFYILWDAATALSSNNYEPGVKIDHSLEIDKIININTNKVLVQGDLVSDTVLPLKVTFTYNGESTEAASSTLNVTTKTDQAIVDYINGYNFSKVMTKTPIPVGTSVADLIKKDWILRIMGSFSGLIDDTSFKINSIKNGNAELKQEDLNKVGTLDLTFNYQYQAINNQNISFKVNISKIDISELVVTQYPDLPITLPDRSKNNLSLKAVTTIKKAITDQIQTALVWATFSEKVIDFEVSITTTDYEVTGIETTVQEGADFSSPKEIIYNIIAKSDSFQFTGKLENQKITVKVTNHS